MDDLREGKRTLRMVRALTLGDQSQRATIRAALGAEELDEDDVARCRHAVAACGAVASVEGLIADQLDVALEALENVPSHVHSALAGLAMFAAHRDS